MHSLIVFPVFLKYLTYAQYMISSWPVYTEIHTDDVR
jgi:hypothetical protein